MTEIYDADDRDRQDDLSIDKAADAYYFDGGLMLQAGPHEVVWMHRHDIADLGEWQ